MPNDVELNFKCQQIWWVRSIKMLEPKIKLTMKNIKFVDLLPNGTEGVILASIDGEVTSTEYGRCIIKTLILDDQKEFVDGKMSCFYDCESNSLKLLSHANENCKYIGRLVASISHYED